MPGSRGPREALGSTRPRQELVGISQTHRTNALNASVECEACVPGEFHLRWTVAAVARPQACCHEVAVCDGPDHVLHWYDHFYCPRGCFVGGRAG